MPLLLLLPAVVVVARGVFSMTSKDGLSADDDVDGGHTKITGGWSNVDSGAGGEELVVPGRELLLAEPQLVVAGALAWLPGVAGRTAVVVSIAGEMWGGQTTAEKEKEKRNE